MSDDTQAYTDDGLPSGLDPAIKAQIRAAREDAA